MTTNERIPAKPGSEMVTDVRVDIGPTVRDRAYDFDTKEIMLTSSFAATSAFLLKVFSDVNKEQVSINNMIDSLNSTVELRRKNRRIKIIFTYNNYVDGSDPWVQPKK